MGHLDETALFEYSRAWCPLFTTTAPLLHALPYALPRSLMPYTTVHGELTSLDLEKAAWQGRPHALQSFVIVSLHHDSPASHLTRLSLMTRTQVSLDYRGGIIYTIRSPNIKTVLGYVVGHVSAQTPDSATPCTTPNYPELPCMSLAFQENCMGQ